MKFNLNDKKIKRFLLKEAKSRVQEQKEANNFFREASIEKEGMAEFKGQRHLRNSAVNLRKWVSDPSPRIQQIKQEIEENFAGFLRARLQVAGKQRLVSIKPGVNLPMAQDFVASTIDPQQQAGLDPGGTLQDQPGEQQNAGIPGKGQGSIYFRYSFTRTVLPQPETDAGNQCAKMIDEFQGVVEQLGAKDPITGEGFNIQEFVNVLEKNRIALVPGFNKAGVASGEIETFIQQQAESLSPADPGVAYLTQEVERINNFRNENLQTQYYTTNARSFPVAYDMTLEGNEAISASIAQERTESALGRMITHKIGSGWALDIDGLTVTIQRYLSQIQRRLEAAETPKAQVEATMGYAKKQWAQQRNKMVRVYEDIAKWVHKSGKEIKQNDVAYATEMAKPEDLRDQKKLSQIKAIWGWQFKVRTEKSKTKSTQPNPSSYKVHTPDSQIPFDWKHMQMILQNLTVKEPSLNVLGYNLAQDQAFDPATSIQLASDGMSHRIGRAKGTGYDVNPYLAPVVKTTTGVSFDHEGVNLGVRQIRRNGMGIVRLLQYGPIAKQIINGLLTGEVDLGRVRSPELIQILTDYPKTFMGADVFYQWIKNMSPEELAAQTQVDLREEVSTPFDPNAPMNGGGTAFDYMREYGYYLAKLMDMVYAIGYSSDITDITITKPEMSRTKPDGTVERRKGKARDVQIHGLGYSTSSGVGGGGEILLSIRYAYPCKLEEFMPDPEQQRPYKRNLGEEIHEGRPGVGFDPLRQTRNVVTSPERRMYEDLQQTEPMAGSQIRVAVMSNLTYFLGQSSTLPTDTGQYSTFHDVSTSKSWEEVKHKMEYLYNIDTLEDDSVAQDMFISECTANMQKLETAVQQSIRKVRETFSQNLVVDVQKFDGEVKTMGEGATTTPTEQPAPETTVLPPTGTGSITETEVPSQEQLNEALGRTPQPEAEPQTQEKPMKVQKDQGGRDMFPKMTPEGKMQSAGVQDTVLKLANIFDEKGYPQIADKLDTLLEKIATME